MSIMDKKEALKILEALADGCSPITGELIEDDHIMNNRDVIWALQYAITAIKQSAQTSPEMEIDKKAIKAAINLLEQNKLKPTANRLAGLLLGTRKFRTKVIQSDPLYGQYRKRFTKGQLLDFLEHYLVAHKYKVYSPNQDEPWKLNPFFTRSLFNNLSDRAMDQLKQKVKAIGIVKTENLNVHIIQARKRYYRSHEPWSEVEMELLTKAMQYTNDLELLSECFGRSKNAIEVCGLKKLYEQQMQMETQKSDP